MNRATEPTLFDVEIARDRGHESAGHAAAKADSLEPGWKLDALRAVAEYARRHSRFLAEQVRVPIPEDADGRAVGHIMKQAERRGWIKPDGFGAAASSNGSPKVAWRSLIYGGTSR